MNKRILYFGLGLVAIPMVLLSIASIIVYANSDEIKNKLIAELSKSSGAHIEIHEKIEFAFFRHLPSMALGLQGVEVYAGDTSLKTPLVKADNVYLLASFWDVIQSNWNIQTTSIENGEVTMLRTKKGITNYDFNPAQSDDTMQNSFAIAIDKALLKNIRFKLTDEINEVDINIHVDDAIVKGNFSADNLSIKTIGNVYSHNIQIKKVDYAHEKQISFDGSLSVIPDEESYLLAIQRFMVGNNEFVINGSITMINSNPVFDLAVSGKDIAIKDLPMLLPAEYASRLNGIKGAGIIQITSEIKGSLDEKNNPLVTILASASDAAMQIPGMDNKIEGLTFKGKFTNGSKHTLATSSLAVTNLNAKMANGALDGNFLLTNFDNLQLRVNVNGMVDLSMFNRFLPGGMRLKEMRGDLVFKNLKYEGKIADLAAIRLAGLEGSVAMKQVALKIDTATVSIAEAEMDAYEKSLSIGKLEIQMPGSKFSVSGKITHVPGFSKQPGSPDMDLTVKAESVDVPAVLAILNNNTSNSDSFPEINDSEPFGFNGSIRLNSSFIGWNRFKAYDASCMLLLKDNVAEIKDFSCNTMDGILDIESKIEMRSGNVASSTTHVKGSNINITELFYQLDNFNQQTITSDNVAGKLEFTADVSADFVNGELNEKSLTSSSQLTIIKGQLTDFKSLDRLSKFIDIEELRNIRFSTLSNTVSISNRIVSIPEMIVNSNALSLSVSGRQSFDGDIDYQVKVNIFDILGKKFRKRKNANDFEEVGENSFNLYLSMTGTTENPVIKNEKQNLRERTVKQKDDFQFFKKNQNDNADSMEQGNVKEKGNFTGKQQKEEPEEELEFIEWDESSEKKP